MIDYRSNVHPDREMRGVGDPMNETQFISKFRQQRGMSQQQLAHAVGVRQQHIAKLESSVHPVRLGIVIQISDVLGQPTA